MRGVDVQTVEAVLAGMSALGVDVSALRARAALPETDPATGVRWSRAAFSVAWAQAAGQFPRENFGAELGMAVPFGAFGAIDYLIASADTMGGGLRSLTGHFRGQLGNPTMTLVEEADGVSVEFRADGSPGRWIGEEFTLAVTLKNCRHIAAQTVPVTEVCTTLADPGTRSLDALLGAPVRYGRSVAALHFGASMMSMPLRTTDPNLRRIMESLAASMHLGAPASPLELAIRARLRDVLPAGEAKASAMARSLGLSERTLHRRLQQQETTWRAVIDSFRCDESKRLLREPGRSLAEIALAVGFSEQTTWARAFRRWTGSSPARWARSVTGGSAAR